jgi:hypothetical protein
MKGATGTFRFELKGYTSVMYDLYVQILKMVIRIAGGHKQKLYWISVNSGARII